MKRSLFHQIICRQVILSTAILKYINSLLSKTNYYILSYDEAKKTAVMREEKTTTSKSIKLTDEQFKKVKETGVKKYVKLKLTK